MCYRKNKEFRTTEMMSLELQTLEKHTLPHLEPLHLLLKESVLDLIMENALHCSVLMVLVNQPRSRV
jgi:hypothetical protein